MDLQTPSDDRVAALREAEVIARAATGRAILDAEAAPDKHLESRGAFKAKSRDWVPTLTLRSGAGNRFEASRDALARIPDQRRGSGRADKAPPSGRLLLMASIGVGGLIGVYMMVS